MAIKVKRKVTVTEAWQATANAEMPAWLWRQGVSVTAGANPTVTVGSGATKQTLSQGQWAVLNADNSVSVLSDADYRRDYEPAQ